MHYKHETECPKCLRLSIELVGYEDLGDYWNPPSFDFDIKQKCSCKFTDEEWNKFEDDLFELFEIVEQIGQVEQGIVELECRMSNVTECSEEELMKLEKIHEKELKRAKGFEETLVEIRTRIYGEM